MPGLIRRSDIDEVRSRVNIADVVGDYVTLKSAGVDSMKGLCPFHEERSPSFHVRPRAGRYHCFGCGEDGDVFTFLQRMDHATFTEAVERMAQRLGYELHYEDGGTALAESRSRSRLLQANAAAQEFFHAQLATPAAQAARDFLAGRGFDAAAAQRFGVGFAPRSFSALGDHLKTLGFTPDELTASGLTSTGERGNPYDRFRGRATWPIRDVTGQVLGFGARKLFDDDQGPKYLNTPETSVYHKSQVLYGLDLARRDIAKSKQVVVVEGYTDVMACHLAGVTTAVATSGTAFGVDHIRVLRRVLGDVDNPDVAGTGQVIFTFDPDEAGQRAAARAFAEEARFAAQTFVAVAPDGLDPCDLRLNRGDEAVRSLVARRKPMFEFMIRRRLAAHDLETVEGRVAALREAAPIVAGIRDRALGVGYTRNLAGWLGMNPDEVSRAVQSATAGRRRGEAFRRVPEDRSQMGDTAYSLADLPGDPVTRGERDALMAALQHPEAIEPQLLARAMQARFASETLAVVRDAIAANLQHSAATDWVERITAEVPAGIARLVSELAVAPLPTTAEQLREYCRAVVASLVERDLLRLKAQLLGALQRANAEGDAARAAEFNRTLAGLELERRRLRRE